MLSKVDTLQLNILSRSTNCNTKKCDNCESKPCESEVKFACKKCEFETHERSELKEHYESDHPTPTFSCDSCDFVTVHSSQLEKHKRTIHPLPKYPCQECNYKAIHERDLTRHMNTMHNTEPFYCNTCEFTSTEELTMKVHVKEAHEPTHQERTFINQTRRRNSHSQNHNTNSFQPNVSKPSSFDNMPNSAPSSSGNQLYCEECKRYFSEKDHFEVHMAFYHGEVNQD